MAIERELKFRLPDITSATELWHALDAKPRRRRLLSTYLDTADGALRRAHAGLRLRRSGRRWLQCFKAEPANGAVLLGRHEWELAARGGSLRTSAFPLSEIRTTTGIDLGMLEDRLNPVFATQFERASIELSLPGARAELAFDQGLIIAGRRSERLREVEFELLEGAFLPLLERVRTLVPRLALELQVQSKAERGYRLAAGEPARPVKASRPSIEPGDDARNAIATVIGACVAQVAANARGAATARDAEYLHQFRVGVRRLRSALRVFRDFAPSASTQRLVENLRSFSPRLGVARDWDVVTELLERRIAPGAGNAVDFVATLRWARRRRMRARREARAVAGSSEFQQLLIDAMIWAELACRAEVTSAAHADLQAGPQVQSDPEPQLQSEPQPQPQPSLTSFARRATKRLARKLEKSGDGCDWSDGGARHRVRIRLKRLRYCCEFFATCFRRKRVRRYLEHLEALQDLLGELNDLATARRLLADPAGVQGIQAAFVQGWLSAREGALIAALAAAWGAFRDQSRPA